MTIESYLREHGPTRSSVVADWLIEGGLKPEAARQRLARVAKPVFRFPIPLLPKKEAFLYLEKDRNGDRFWDNFMRDLRASNSVFGAAIDGMIARGGHIRASQFATISAAPNIIQRGQLSVDVVAKRLLAAGFMKEIFDSEGEQCYELAASLSYGGEAGWRAKDLTERIILDAVREWARKIGLASYNSIRIRGDLRHKAIGPFSFDLAGPSYLLPLQGGGAKNGFLVADVFADGMLDANEVQYFIRKAKMLKSTLKDIGVLSILVAEGFRGEALTAGHAAGIVMATTKDLFGQRVGAALSSLIEVLKNAAAYASSSPERLQFLLDTLFEIEGRNNNLRGALFELVAGHLARLDAVSIDMNLRVKDPATGKPVEIDVLKIMGKGVSVTAIECKGKEPGGQLTLTEVQDWLRKTAVMRSYLRDHGQFRESEHRFEIWTSGTIAADALALLEEEQKKRIKAPIGWKDGKEVLAIARGAKEKGIADALNQHFLQHPFATVAATLAAGAPPQPPRPPPPALPGKPSTSVALVDGYSGYYNTGPD